MTKPLYVCAPRFEIAAESGPAPRLGSIFKNFVKLTGPMNRGEELPVPESIRNEVSVPDFGVNLGKSVGANLGVCASLVQGVLGSVGVEHAFSSSHYNSFKCQLLETTEFEPTEQFVRDSIKKSQEVQNFFNGGSSLHPRRAYMIAGLKIAMGFAAAHRSSAEHAHGVEMEVGAACLGVPISVGPKLGLMAGSSREITHGPASRKIVVAYRAIAIKSKGDGKVQIKDNIGSLFSADDDSEEEEEEEQSWETEPVGEEYVLENFTDEEVIPIQMQV